MLTSAFRFKLTSTGSGYSVSLSVESGEEAQSRFQFDLNPDSRLNQVIQSMVDGIVGYDDLRDVGANLFTGLINGSVRDLYLTARRTLETSAAATPESGKTQIVLRLDLPVELRALPWECLYEEERAPGFLLNEPGYSLVRDTANVDLPPLPRRTLPVRMLVVIPQGSNLNVGKELHGLDVAVGKLSDAIGLSILDGQVTPDRLRARMEEGPWDIVHFIGHGQVVNGDALVRLNDENPESDDQWVNGEIFASFFQRSVPRLVVLNCCYGGSQASLRTLSGLGPFLLRAGVPAAVAMQYEIPDKVAIKFAETFYGELLNGKAPGRIDCALTAARLALYQNQTKDRPQSFVTPVLYLVPGHEAILEISAIRPAPAPVSLPAAAPAVVLARLPDDLLEAFRDRRVVPVIGPDLFAVGAVRTSRPPPGPHELAQQLAQEAGYPRMGYFRLPDAAAEETGVWLLPAVCQHYERKYERWKLLMAVQKVYKEFPPPPAIEQIAGWNVPGIICAYFDGLLDAAMARQERVFRTLHSVDEKAAGLQDETLVVHVRGVYSQDESLVLTEKDHELLLDKMVNLSSQVSDLARKSVGRSLLYLGVSPRDPLIRRLTRAVRGNGRNQGPMYFVSPDQTQEDAYWDDYNVRWLPMKLEEFMAAVAEAGSGVRT